MQSLVVHENFLFSFQSDFGPLISVGGEMTPHVLHLGLQQGVPTELSEDSPSSERDNLNILQTDETTSDVFSDPPLISYRKDRSLKQVLVKSSLPSLSEERAPVFSAT